MTTLYSYHDRARLTIYPQAGGVVQLGAGIPGRSASPLLSVSFSKTLPQNGSASHAGVLAFTVRWTPEIAAQAVCRSWSELLQDGAWFVLHAEANGRAHVVTFGMTGEVTDSVTLVDGAAVKTWNIQAADWAQAIDATQVWFCETAADPNLFGARMIELLSYDHQGPPDEICKAFVRGFLYPATGDGGTWEMPAAFAAAHRIPPSVWEHPGTLHTILDLDSQVSQTRGVAVVQNSVFGPEFNLASLIEEWSNGVLNEVFFDMRGTSPGVLTPCMVMRERPFPSYLEDASAWDQLPRCVLPTTRLLSGTSLTTARERYNVFLLSPATSVITPTENLMNNAPVINRTSVRKHGMRKFEPTTRFLDIPDEQGALLPAEVQRWQWLLNSWYGVNHRLLAGDLAIKGFVPELRIGRRVTIGAGQHPDLDPERLTAYIEGVTLSWSPPPGGWQTQLTVTRGVRGDYTGTIQQMMSEHFAELSAVAQNAPRLPLVPAEPLFPCADLLSYQTGGSSLLRRGV